MRLDKIVLDGFKSFADKTDFVFDASVTAIVGPNGCGKSNVVDAVKWVLGEQRLKSLRSDQMADVIFSGSGSRKATGAAEVTLLISNPEGAGTGRLPIDTDQVQISRRVYRSGESEYRINNKLCRLKDVRELFMDTGVGTRAYSIIEQGQIEQLLSASKQDRRAVFEEAAGISKYKAHKKEALRKLERTEQNLLRLADILGEVTKRLRSVKLAAGKARNYLQYSQRLKELQVNYSLVEYAKNHRQLDQKRARLAQAEERLAEVAAEIGRADAAVSRLGNEVIEKEQKLNETGNSLVAVQSRIEQQLQRIEFLRARIEELDKRRESERQKVETLREQRDAFKADLSRHRGDLANCEQMLEEKSQAATHLEEEIRKTQIECASLEAGLADEKSGIIDIVRRTAQLHNEIQSLSVYRKNLSSQKDRLASRAESARAELEKLLTEKAHYKARLADIEKVLTELQQNLDGKQKETEEIETSLVGKQERLAHSKEARSALNGELAVLADMEARFEGLAMAVKGILQKQSDENTRLDYIEGILAEVITTDVEYAAAVEAALEGQTDALIVTTADKLLADTETTDALDGRVGFICLDKVEPFVDKKDFSKLTFVKGRLAEFVKCDSKYAPLVWKLLGKTIVVDSLRQAMELADEIKDGYTFVTLAGECLDGVGSIKLGPLGKTTGLISRKSRMRQLEDAIASVTSEIKAIEEQIESDDRRKAHVARLQKDLRTAVYEANTEKMQVNARLAAYEQDVKRLRDEEPLITSEIDLLEEQIAQSVQKEYDSKQKLDELDAVNSERTAHIGQLEAKYAEQKQQQQSGAERLTGLRVELGQIAEQRKGLEQIITSLTRQTQANANAAEAAEAEVQNCGLQSEQAKRDILSCESLVSEWYVEKEQSQQNNQLLQDEIENLLEEQKQTEQQLRVSRDQKGQVDEEISQLKVELGQLEVKNEDLVERVQEELQIDLAEAFKEYEDREVDWEAIRAEITELRGKIERLGNVNLDAIDEQESLEQRHDFLSTQVEDLNKSKGQLQQLINRLNKKSREKFAKTFEEIRGHFQQIFRKLFGGGKADIVLEDAEDILDAGIEVIARPPGKETRSISLLSGGEKSMTALALLFAVFRTKPSPFCFLDEVDAALDEANNERFNLLLGEFRKDTQFIVITHAKRTMSIADVLLGITMQTQGVSKKIGVRFSEYGAEEETAAVA
ncbi:MAG: chromosome segregation protein SMC [Phycisphaerales bacterium]|nr:MAG: chromosome segregation protein SMC [Phycisphaerales bacterium]